MSANVYVQNCRVTFNLLELSGDPVVQGNQSVCSLCCRVKLIPNTAQPLVTDPMHSKIY